MMNSTECTIVQRLIAELDNTRLLLTTLRPLLIRPHLKFLVERMADAHATAADGLAAQVERTGGLTARRGTSASARLRTLVERWMVITSADIELGCLKSIARHEFRVIQRFRHTLESVKALHQNLHRDLSQLERSLFRIDMLMREMEMPLAAAPGRRPAAIPASTHERSRS